jgi:tRNA 2-selenouridine synthase SelU
MEPKIETVEEFLARGGKIEKIPTVKFNNIQRIKVKGSAGGYKTEINTVKTKTKSKCDVSIDYTQIPSELLEKVLKNA